MPLETWPPLPRFCNNSSTAVRYILSLLKLCQDSGWNWPQKSHFSKTPNETFWVWISNTVVNAENLPLQIAFMIFKHFCKIRAAQNCESILWSKGLESTFATTLLYVIRIYNFITVNVISPNSNLVATTPRFFSLKMSPLRLKFRHVAIWRVGKLGLPPRQKS